jgi:hypothetical protein
VALAVSYFTTITSGITTTAALYTTPTTGYNRDLVIANGSTCAIYVSAGPAITGALTTSSFNIPSGQQVVLMGQVPTSTIAYACVAVSGNTANSVSLGWASVVSVI